MADESKTFGLCAGVTIYVQPYSRTGIGTNWYNNHCVMMRQYVSHTLLLAESDFNEWFGQIVSYIWLRTSLTCRLLYCYRWLYYAIIKKRLYFNCK